MEKQIRIWCTNTRKRRLNITREEYLKKHNQNFNRKIQKNKIKQQMNNKLQGYDESLFYQSKDFSNITLPLGAATSLNFSESYDFQTAAEQMARYLEEEGYCSCDFYPLSIEGMDKLF